MEKYDVVVLGAGLTGMSFAYHYDRKIPIFEKESAPGGLTRTIAHDGCHFDMAPHFLHLRSDDAKNLVFKELGNEFEKVERHSSIYIHDKIVPYPFELNLAALDEKTRNECLDGVRAIKKLGANEIDDLKKGSYRDYALKAFGKGISENYLLPYNRKIWDTDPADMTCEWMTLLPTVDKDEILTHAGRKKAKTFGYNASFFYPVKKGIRELADSLAARLPNIHLSETAVAVDLDGRSVRFASDRAVHFNQLISTVPLKELAALSGDERLIRTARELQWTTVYNFNLVVRGSVPAGVHWIYFPDPEVEFYRVSFPKSYFANSAPRDQAIISVEIGSRDHGLDVDVLQRQVMARIVKMRLFKIDEVIRVKPLVIPVAYCIHDRKRTRVVAELTAALAAHGIKTIGRYGRWEYSAMEDALLQGRDLAAELRRDS